MDFETKLEHLAELAVRVGVNLQYGQRLRLNVPLEAAPLARMIVRKAYEAGACYVDQRWTDDLTDLQRIEHSRDEFLTYFNEEAIARYENATMCGDARIAIRSVDPLALANADPERMDIIRKTQAERLKPSMNKFHSSMVNWCIVPYAIPAWARQVLPDQPEDVALERLWSAIFTATRADQTDPVGAWQTHLNDLELRRGFLNDQRLKALVFKAPGTDLRIELPELHRWEGGSAQTHNPNHPKSIVYVPNIPTEEIFTMPHRLGVNGTARATKPLFRNGKVIEGIEMTFKDGRVIEARASKNERSLHQILETDEGASRLGEVALATESSAVAKTGLLFYDTLLDENAACHIALGKAYSYTMQGGHLMSKPELEQNGANDSRVHVDWMIGSQEMDVTGMQADGSSVALLCNGEWAFEV